jgi:hypothetical protein
MLIDLIIVLIVVGLILYAVSLLPLPSPIGQIVQVLVILIAVLWLLRLLGVVTSFG